MQYPASCSFAFSLPSSFPFSPLSVIRALSPLLQHGWFFFPPNHVSIPPTFHNGAFFLPLVVHFVLSVPRSISWFSEWSDNYLVVFEGWGKHKVLLLFHHLNPELVPLVLSPTIPCNCFFFVWIVNCFYSHLKIEKNELYLHIYLLFHSFVGI